MENHEPTQRTFRIQRQHQAENQPLTNIHVSPYSAIGFLNHDVNHD